MDRLTYRTEKGWVGVKNLEDKTVSPTSVAIHKLTDIEDFIEEYGFENWEDLKKYIEESFRASIILAKRSLQIKKLNDRWQKLEECVEEYLKEEPSSLVIAFMKVLAKMQELKKGEDKNEYT